jgi:hydroxymethylpyrimidine pyrophosphatase-like HAD family hydrolase
MVYNELGFDTIVGNYNGAHIHKPHDEGFIPTKTTINREIIDEINETLMGDVFDNFVIEDENETLI